MAVSTYRSLSNYVSSNLLTRLITKKIWTNERLWEGFILCARQTAPASFGALIQLPKEQLHDVLDKQSVLREGLREYLEKKAGGNRARLNGFLELINEASAAETPAASSTAHVIDGENDRSAPPIQEEAQDGIGEATDATYNGTATVQDPQHGMATLQPDHSLTAEN